MNIDWKFINSFYNCFYLLLSNDYCKINAQFLLNQNIIEKHIFLLIFWTCYFRSLYQQLNTWYIYSFRNFQKFCISMNIDWPSGRLSISIFQLDSSSRSLPFNSIRNSTRIGLWRNRNSIRIKSSRIIRSDLSRTRSFDQEVLL